MFFNDLKEASYRQKLNGSILRALSLFIFHGTSKSAFLIEIKLADRFFENWYMYLCRVSTLGNYSLRAFFQNNANFIGPLK